MYNAPRPVTLIAYDTTSGKPLDFLVVRTYESTSGAGFILWPVAHEGQGPGWDLGESKSIKIEVQYVRAGETTEEPGDYAFVFPPIGLCAGGEGGCHTSITRPGYKYAGYIYSGDRSLEFSRLSRARGDVGLTPITHFIDETLPHMDRTDPLARMVVTAEATDLELAVGNKTFKASEQAQAEDCLKKLRGALGEFKCSPAELSWPLPSADDVTKACELLANSKDVPEPRQVQAVVTLWRTGDERSRTTLLKCLASENDPVRTTAAIALGALKEERSRQPLIDHQHEIGLAAKEALEMLGEPTRP
jgi:hypothetical protein